MISEQKVIKIACTGTGSTDGLASQLLCKLNAIIFSSFYNYQYLEIPFDDSYIRGNSGHRFGPYSTALQNTIFTFPGFEKINPLTIDYGKIKTFAFKEIPKSIRGHAAIREYLNAVIETEKSNFDIFVLNGFAGLFNDKIFLYNKISKGKQLIVDPYFLNHRVRTSDRFKICVHVRRGDILQHDIHAHRIIPIDYFDNVLERVRIILSERQIRFDIHLHTEGFSEVFDHEVRIFPDANPMESFIDFFDADLIISSKSSHSNLPALLCGNLMICPADSWFAPLPHWLKADEHGSFDVDRFKA
jgi:hypothetical protein